MRQYYFACAGFTVHALFIPCCTAIYWLIFTEWPILDNKYLFGCLWAGHWCACNQTRSDTMGENGQNIPYVTLLDYLINKIQLCMLRTCDDNCRDAINEFLPAPYHCMLLWNYLLGKYYYCRKFPLKFLVLYAYGNN